MSGDELLKGWSTDMPRLAMSHFITGKDAFVPLVQALSAPGSGYEVKAQERTDAVEGHYMTYYRIYANRIDPKTKLSLAEYEVRVISPPMHPEAYLPVTMNTHWTPRSPGALATVNEWAGRWSDLKYDASDYKLPDN